jgi:hypothetical protein
VAGDQWPVHILQEDAVGASNNCGAAAWGLLTVAGVDTVGDCRQVDLLLQGSLQRNGGSGKRRGWWRRG